MDQQPEQPDATETLEQMEKRRRGNEDPEGSKAADQLIVHGWIALRELMYQFAVLMTAKAGEGQDPVLMEGINKLLLKAEEYNTILVTDAAFKFVLEHRTGPRKEKMMELANTFYKFMVLLKTLLKKESDIGVVQGLRHVSEQIDKISAPAVQIPEDLTGAIKGIHEALQSLPTPVFHLPESLTGAITTMQSELSSLNTMIKGHPREGGQFSAEELVVLQKLREVLSQMAKVPSMEKQLEDARGSMFTAATEQFTNLATEFQKATQEDNRKYT